MPKKTSQTQATIHQLRPRRSAPAAHTRRNQPFTIYQMSVAHQIDTLGDKAYGIEIWTRLAKGQDNVPPITQLYIALKRMKEYKLITPTKKPSPHHKGKYIVVYKLTDEGRRLLNEARNAANIATA
jgi:hypothetical protein